MLRFLKLVALACCLFAFTACGKSQDKSEKEAAQPSDLPGVASENGRFRVEARWLTTPSFESEDNRCDLYFFDADGEPKTGVTIDKITPWMTSMGHGAPTIDLHWTQDEKIVEQTVLHVEGLMFTMGGTWDLKMDAVVDGVAEKVVVPVDVPK